MEFPSRECAKISIPCHLFVGGAVTSLFSSYGIFLTTARAQLAVPNRKRSCHVLTIWLREISSTSFGQAFLFAGNSLFGPVINTSSGQTLAASDIFLVPGAGATVLAGDTFGLGHLFFDVGAGSGTFAVLLSPFPASSLSDQVGNDLPFISANGQIDVSGGTAVPEPNTVLLLATGVAALAARRRVAKR